MNMRAVKTIIFVFWIVVIAVLSIIPHANEVEGLSFKLTESGMILHFGAYFVGTALVYWAFIKGPQISQTRLSERSVDPAIGAIAPPASQARALRAGRHERAGYTD